MAARLSLESATSHISISSASGSLGLVKIQTAMHQNYVSCYGSLGSLFSPPLRSITVVQDQLWIIVDYGQLRSFTVNYVRRLRSITVNYNHLRSIPIDCGQFRSVTVDYGRRLRSITVIYGQFRSIMVNSGQLRSTTVANYGQLRSFTVSHFRQ